MPDKTPSSEDGRHKEASHGHHHGIVEPAVYTTRQGIRAVRWSLLGLLITAGIQVIIYSISQSVALLADTIHNFADAATAIPLWIAFRMQQRQPNDRFTYGYGRLEDLAGLLIIGIILASAVAAGYQAIYRLLFPQTITYLGAVMGAAVVGFIGNEAVAQYRIRVGREIGSAALVADGKHARVDGLTSLAVLFGALGAWFGYPITDPLVGMLITVAILRIVWQSGKTVFTRLLDGTDPDVVREIRHAAGHTQEVLDVSDVHVRWLGHRMHAEINIAVHPDRSITEGHRIAMAARHYLLHHLKYLSDATVHVDPATKSGEQHHRVKSHRHGDYPEHSH